MNTDDRKQFDGMKEDLVDVKTDIRGIKDDMHLLLTNHLPHIEEEVEQVWGLAGSAETHAAAAEKAAKETKSFVRWAIPAGIAFMGLIIAIVACFG